MSERYNELLRLYQDGFFDDVKDFDEQFFSKDGRLETNMLDRLWEMFGFKKYTLKYYLIHRDLMPVFGCPPKYKDADDLEALYKECLEKNETWQEASGYIEPDENTVY